MASANLGYMSSPVVPDFYTGWGNLTTLMHDIAMSIDFHNKEATRSKAEKLLDGDRYFGISDITYILKKIRTCKYRDKN